MDGGSGGPAPFLLKTYDMVDDASTDDIVSWSPTNASFVVWKPLDFTAGLLPTYFKHNNFSSFIRQLNTYGFRKIDPDRWEFANEDFVKGQRHLLKNIHRRKPIHSHSHPPTGGLADAERAALEEEIERLNKEKADLVDNLWNFKQKQSGTEIQIGDLERRLADMEQRQFKMVAFLRQVMQNRQLMENLLKMAAASSMDISLIHKKRRLPPNLDYYQEALVNSFCDDQSNTDKTNIGYVIDQDFCDKLRLELSSAVLDDEDNGSLKAKQIDCGQELIERQPLITEGSQLCDKGAPNSATKNGLFVRAIDEGDGLFPCPLSLTLASSAMQIDSGNYSSITPDLVDQGEDDTTDLRTANATYFKTSNTADGNDLSIPIEPNQIASGDFADAKALSSQEVLPTSNEAPAVPIGVNDVFWRQFLTERPGSYGPEETSSFSRVNPFDEQMEESMPGNDNAWRSKKDMEQLKL